MILENGTVRVTEGSQDLVFENASIYDAGVIAGTKIKIAGNPNVYHFGETPVDNVNGKLLEIYAGTSQENASYQIFQDIEEFGLIKIQKGIAEVYDAIAYNFDIVSKELVIAGAPEDYNQVINKFFFGNPIADREFGYLFAPFDMKIVKLRLCTDENAPNGDLIVDIAIEDVYQGLNLTVPQNNIWKESGDLTYSVSQGEKVNFKWVSPIPSYPGSNWCVEIIYQSVPVGFVRYDFQGICFGDLIQDKVIGRGFKFPVKSKLLGFHYEFLGLPPLGSEAIVEVLKDGVSLATPVTGSLVEGSNCGMVPLSQTDFEITEEFSLKIAQPGSSNPGSNLVIVAHTYRIE